ncbi:MAG: tetratricopeptide repeat protein [Candidatus Obscuribacterales bacterium]|nr:tetratricopeptide repeat protein [Candidatus Obscuribacterales bacterium]
MSNTFNTLVSNLSTVVNAVNLYQSGRYRDAISSLQELLDLEPNNWEARLMLAVCFYKTGQLGAAHRAFDLIVERTTDLDIRQKALEGTEVTRAKLQGHHVQVGIPAECG